MDLSGLGLVIACLIGFVVILILLPIIFQGLAGAAAMVAGLASLGCGSLFLGILFLVVIAAICGFVAARLPV